MSTPYPPQPRRLMRDPSKKLIGGVCAGLAKYLNMDVNLVRVLTVIISLFTGVPIVLYLIALFVMPEEQSTPTPPPYVNGPQPGVHDAGSAWQGSQYGASTQPPVDQVWGPGGAPWEQPQPVSQPTASAAAPAPQAWTPSPPEPTVVEPSSPEPTIPEPTIPEATGTEATGYDTAPVTPEPESTVPRSPDEPPSDTKA